MLKKTLLVLFAAVLLTLASASQAQSWGAYHAGYYNYNSSGGWTHYGNAGVYGPYGEHTHTGTTSYNPGSGWSHSGYGQTTGYGGERYGYHSSTAYGGYGRYYGGFHGAYGGYGRYAGAFRRW
jgi:hypothetical protein